VQALRLSSLQPLKLLTPRAPAMRRSVAVLLRNSRRRAARRATLGAAVPGWRRLGGILRRAARSRAADGSGMSEPWERQAERRKHQRRGRRDDRASIRRRGAA
jgi:hypothetical protein